MEEIKLYKRFIKRIETVKESYRQHLKIGSSMPSKESKDYISYIENILSLQHLSENTTHVLRVLLCRLPESNAN